MKKEKTPRELEIIDAANRMRDAYRHWIDETPEGTLPTDRFEEACEGFIAICDGGDIPESCRDLLMRAANFAELWRSYTDGGFEQNDGFPTAPLIQSLEAVITASRGVEFYRPKRIESVKTLLDQRVSYSQIANHIYGRDGVGPFLGPSGEVLHDLIEQEAKEPGSVIPANWIHPAEKAAIEESARKMRTRISAVAGPKKAPKEDPVALLREGAYVSQVASVCGLTVDEVYELCEEHDITPSVMPNLASERAPQEREDTEERLAGANPANPQTDPSATDDAPEDIDEIEQTVILYAEANPSAGAAELVKILKEDGKISLSAKRVAQIMRRAKVTA